MKLAMSNIAWNLPEDPAIAEIFRERGVTGVEIAPTKIWPKPLEAADAEVAEYVRFWAERGITISSMQALLFGRPDLTIFGSAEKRRETVEYLTGIVALAGRLGAGPLVFGSPKNRFVGDLDRSRAEEIAVEFFLEMGRIAADHGTLFCLEPNPRDYGCDFVTTSAEGLDLVAKVDHPGFRLHLDAAGMTLAGEEIETALSRATPDLAHFHISEPGLEPIGTGKVDHGIFSRVLRENGYRGWVSVEMRAPGGDDNISGVAVALEAVRRHYR